MPIPYDSVKTVSASFVRPANTTAYSVNDVLSGATSSGTAMTFLNAARDLGGGGYITDVMIVDSAYSATATTFDLFLFNTNPTTAINDNASFQPTDAELANVSTVININTPSAGSATIGAAGNRLFETNGVNRQFVCADSSSDLYGVLVARTAYNPISAEEFTVRLKIMEDTSR